MKKLVSLCLALAMCLALAIPVLATEETFDTTNSTLIPTVNVVLPSNGVVILNPYGMTYTAKTAMPGIGNGSANATTTDQIISNLFHVTNKTQDAKLKLSIAFTGVTEGEAVLEETANAFESTETAKKVILNLKCGVTNTKASAVPTAVPTTGMATARVTTSEQKFTDLILGDASSTEFTYVTFQFSGSAVAQPETPWNDSDLVGATFVFTFEPAPANTTASNAVTVAS